MTDTPYLVPHSKEPIRILYQDDSVLVVRKPHLLLSIPGRHPANKDCLLHRLQKDWPTAGMVHRLDLDTSGVMIIPLNKVVHAHIARQFQERKVEKTYIAEVFGILKDDAGTIDLPIARDWPNRPQQKICFDTGKASITHYEVIKRHADRTRVLLKPVTGRTHQLRLHLAAIDHPILGCDMYAHTEALGMSERLLLHATTISFEHPMSGEDLFVECLPDF